MEIKVCGPGCANCTKAEEVVKEAVAESGVAAEVEKIWRFNEAAGPSLEIAVDGQLSNWAYNPDEAEKDLFYIDTRGFLH